MATRRPSVPKATFTAGIGSAPATSGHPAKAPTGPAADNAEAEGIKPAPGHGGSPTSAKGKAGSGKGSGKAAGKTGGKERKPTSSPSSRKLGEGVVHSADNSPVPARSFSGRLLVLGLAMGVVTVLLAPNVHTFLQQRAEISALRADIATKEAQQDTFEAELARWDDPAYIKQQARDRVSMLMPGETGYWVYGANGVEAVAGAPTAGDAKSSTAKTSTEITVEPWVDGLWEAVQDSAKVEAKPPATPAPKADPAPAP
ncbi:Cell division protein FtsB [Arthrobacter alpinus]|uniref:Cell division protein FtsB n=1 Tax=Arthrobacter alpinus TaxID=656366 RepID=A0A1H5KS10_9MICC|nr:septum formation initiator family protein [Arthrobacter alpinus]SEE67414.1 Cell division protein FtsB [Arthrobacter alpinus]